MDNIQYVPSKDDNLVHEDQISDDINMQMDGDNSSLNEDQEELELQQSDNILQTEGDIQVPGTSNADNVRQSVVKETVHDQMSGTKAKKTTCDRTRYSVTKKCYYAINRKDL